MGLLDLCSNEIPENTMSEVTDSFEGPVIFWVIEVLLPAPRDHYNRCQVYSTYLQMHLHSTGSLRLGSPASSTRTDTEGSSESRVASARPAVYIR